MTSPILANAWSYLATCRPALGLGSDRAWLIRHFVTILSSRRRRKIGNLKYQPRTLRRTADAWTICGLVLELPDPLVCVKFISARVQHLQGGEDCPWLTTIKNCRPCRRAARQPMPFKRRPRHRFTRRDSAAADANGLSA